MPRSRKLFIHSCVYFITMSIQQGLPLLSHNLMKEIALSNLARACELYPVILGDLLLMGNHVHLTLKVIDPGNVDQFIGRFKTEMAHAINKLKGVSNITVWNEGYDSPIILDLDTLIEKTAYIYSNPQKASLVNTIEEYPNLSTWEAFNKTGFRKVDCYRISRSSISSLPKRIINADKTYSDKLKELIVNKKRTNKILFNPKACFEALKNTYHREITYEEYKKKVSIRVREEETLYIKVREQSNKSILGSRRLLQQDILKKYLPEKRAGRKMLCLAIDKESRIKYINFFRSLAVQAFEAVKLKRMILFPPGLFPPGRRPIASLLPSAIV